MDWASSHWRDGDSNAETEDGVKHPIELVKLGVGIWRRSNYVVIPDPKELAKINRQWLTDLATLDNLIERAKPPE